MGNWFSGRDAAEAAPAVKPVKVSAWDSTGMKRTLDDNIGNIICEQTGLAANNLSFDIKLLLMALACAVGALAQFHPATFPENKALVVACVIAYFVLSTIYQCIVWFIDKDYLLITKAKKPEDVVCIRTQMAKHAEHYTVIAERPKGVELVKKQFSVGEFFTEDGLFSENHFAHVLQEHISSAVTESGSKKTK